MLYSPSTFSLFLFCFAREVFWLVGVDRALQEDERSLAALGGSFLSISTTYLPYCIISPLMIPHPLFDPISRDARMSWSKWLHRAFSHRLSCALDSSLDGSLEGWIN